MSHHNGLPGFDAWLTNQPDFDGPEPEERHLKAAREELEADGVGEPPTFEEIYNLACMMIDREVRDSNREAEEHAAESRREDEEDRYGDGPY